MTELWRPVWGGKPCDNETLRRRLAEQAVITREPESFGAIRSWAAIGLGHKRVLGWVFGVLFEPGPLVNTVEIEILRFNVHSRVGRSLGARTESSA